MTTTLRAKALLFYNVTIYTINLSATSVIVRYGSLHIPGLWPGLKIAIYGEKGQTAAAYSLWDH